jgi:CubicO group peptidase (beta-lactamase class C family)
MENIMRRFTCLLALSVPFFPWSAIATPINAQPGYVQPASGDDVARLKTDSYPVEDIKFNRPDGNQQTVKGYLKSSYTDGFIALHHDKINYEFYADDEKPSDLHGMASVTKSVVGSLASDLIAQGKLNPSEQVTHYVPELSDSAWKGATVQQTLDMTTAMKFNEDYSDPNSDIAKYSRAVSKGSLRDYLRTVKPNNESTHGEKFHYRSVNPEVIGWVMEKLTGKSLNDMVSKKIWQPMGAESDTRFSTDAEGTPLAAGGLNATLRDMARFGEMVLHRGKYNGHQILDPEAYDALFLKGYPVTLPGSEYSHGRKGFKYHDFWWQADDEDNVITGWGVGGQILYINPTDGVVIVKQSSRPDLLNSPYTGIDMNALTAIDKSLASHSVPEPASWGIFGASLGLIGVAMFARRRRAIHHSS